ncbi:MAG: methyltransferase [Clostridia bacterium]|nr:methyltransferase [Clostridia bacterium]
MEQTEKLFRGELRIIQNSTSPRFSLDSVLLASFAEQTAEGPICDLGCGTGIITLLLAYKYPNSRVFGVEIMAEPAELAARSVQLNGLVNRITIINGDLRQLNSEQLPKMALVAANPPYYLKAAGRPSPDPLRSAARTECNGTFRDFLLCAQKLLAQEGRFCFCLPLERKEEVLELVTSTNMHILRTRLVRTSAGNEPYLMLMETGFAKVKQVMDLPDLVVFTPENRYNPEIENIFYGKEK